MQHIGIKALILIALVTLAGCGGSSGGGTPPPPAGSSNWDEMVWDQDNWT